MSTEMVFERVEDVLVICHSPNPPSDEEWNAMIECLNKYADVLVGLIVSTAGASINATQRAQVSEAIRDRPIRTAVLTDSMLVRGAVTALSWIGLRVKAFEPAQTRAAITWLESRDAKKVEVGLAKLRLRLSPG